MKNPEDIRKEDFEKMKIYLGEDKAKKYFENDNYPFKAIGIMLLYLEIKSFAKRRPYLFFAIILVILLLTGFTLYSKFFYY